LCCDCQNIVFNGNDTAAEVNIFLETALGGKPGRANQGQCESESYASISAATTREKRTLLNDADELSFIAIPAGI
jgi:hypothetical protein